LDLVVSCWSHFLSLVVSHGDELLADGPEL
jgi:hypothetical protein